MSPTLAPEPRKPLVLESELLAALRPRRDGQGRRASFWKGYAYLGPHGRFRKSKGQVEENIGALPFKEPVRGHLHQNVEISRRAAHRPGVSLICDANPGPRIDTRRDLDSETFLFLNAALTPAIGAWLRYDGSRSVALRTGMRELKGALGHLFLACSAAPGTGRSSGAGFGAFSTAAVADCRMAEHDGDLGPFISVYEGDLQAVVQVLSPRWAPPLGPA